MPLTKDGYLYTGYDASDEDNKFIDKDRKIRRGVETKFLTDFIEFLDKEQFDICLGDLTKKAINKFLDERSIRNE